MDPLQLLAEAFAEQAIQRKVAERNADSWQARAEAAEAKLDELAKVQPVPPLAPSKEVHSESLADA